MRQAFPTQSMVLHTFAIMPVRNMRIGSTDAMTRANFQFNARAIP